MKITIIGSGYVGLVSGTCLAEVGNHVMCCDVDKQKIATLNAGEVPIFEPGLKELIAKNVAAGRLFFTDDLNQAISFGTAQFIAVGTPPDEDGSADLSYVLSAAQSIGKCMNDYKIIVDKSTVPVGTAQKVKQTIGEELKKRGASIPFGVVSNPEFLKEGAAIDDFMRPDRIIIGSDDEHALNLMRQIYAPFQRNHERIIATDLQSAELIKYASNAMLATRISFMNELANLAEKLGADIELVRRGMGADPRIGYHFLYPGCGYGGSCFPKDVKALIHTAKNVGIDLEVLSAVELANAKQKHVLTQKIIQRFGENLNGKNFALWGLAFKPNTDDMREAPSRVLIEDLLEKGANISVYDPVAMQEARRVFGENPRIIYALNPMDAAQNKEALVIVTEWKEFRSPDFEVLKTTLKNPVIFDGRNLYDPVFLRNAGFEYFAIGR